ncbi:MAG: SPOR domain-containing protein [Deltaproteobacteria bacterium]|nr:SPOR domain-containing protein [Deltaproteobacteria bacterium]
MRDSRRIRERVEVRLERMQLIWLTLGAVIALGAVFALGMMVGKRAAYIEARNATRDSIAEIDADGERLQKLTFYNKLTAPSEEARSNRKEMQAKLKTETASPIVSQNVDETTASAVEQIEKGKKLSNTEPKAATPAPTEIVNSPPTMSSSHKVKDTDLIAALGRGPAQPGEFTVQVSSFQTIEEAKAYAASLERKGYRPFVISSKINGKGTWYRVRMGRFKDVEKAKDAKALLARADIPAWILKAD